MSRRRLRAASVQVSELDVAQAREAFDALLPRLTALREAELVGVRVDLQLASATAYSLARRDVASERRARFERLAATGYFTLTHLDELSNLALAGWHARQKQLQQEALATNAAVPEAELKNAQQLRARMLRVLEHCFGDDPEMARALAAIRAGTGYEDLANDLVAVADLYDDPELHEVVVRDPVHFRATDSVDARAAATAVFRGIGLAGDGEGASWASFCQRAWTLLCRGYAEVRAAGRFAFRHDEDVDLTYPSLVAAVRPPRSADSLFPPRAVCARPSEGRLVVPKD